MRAASCGSITACVPTICAITPPRSISPTSTTGTRSACAKPIFAISPARRLISAGRARAFHQHQIRLAAQDREALAHACEQLRLEPGVIARPRRGQTLTLDDDLRAGLAFRLEQDGVHVDRCRHARRACLQGLGTPDLAAAIIGDGGIVRHVLRLERAHAQPAPGKDPREPGNEHGFADIWSRRPGSSMWRS